MVWFEAARGCGEQTHAHRFKMIHLYTWTNAGVSRGIFSIVKACIGACHPGYSNQHLRSGRDLSGIWGCLGGIPDLDMPFKKLKKK